MAALFSPEAQIGIAFAVFLLLLVAGMAVPFAIALPAMLYLVLQGGIPALKGLSLVSWGSMDSFSLTAIPLFILMAEIMQHSGLSFRIYRGLSRLTAPVPGGLLQTNIVGCALFAAISGSSVATAASIGGVALPELLRRGYDRRMSAGSLAAGGTLGILMPPSIAMIVYGTFTDTSVAKLFMAGVVPGLTLTAMFMLYIAIRSRIGRPITPLRDPAMSPQPLGAALIDIVPFVILIGGTMGSMYLGLATPTEAAAAGCMLAIVLAALWGGLTRENFVQSFHRTIKICANLLFIIYAAYIFAYAIDRAGIGEMLTGWIIGMNLSRWGFLFALFLLYTVMGCVVESIGMIVITVPLVFPMLRNLGIDPVWFGVILVLFVELGQISPPIGINLFVIQSIWTGTLKEIVAGTIPFHLLMFGLLILLALVPELALWLPDHMTVR